MVLPAPPQQRGPFTEADRDALPDDGHPVELIDGWLVVSPSATRPHNDMVMHLFRLLDGACPPDITVYCVPYDFALGEGSILIPDILVARTSDLGEKRMTETPLLVVEVISPSSRRMDPVYKRAKYEARGVPAYWIADPDEPSLTVLELADGRYVTRHVLQGPVDVAHLERPYPVAVLLPAG